LKENLSKERKMVKREKIMDGLKDGGMVIDDFYV